MLLCLYTLTVQGLCSKFPSCHPSISLFGLVGSSSIVGRNSYAHDACVQNIVVLGDVANLLLAVHQRAASFHSTFLLQSITFHLWAAALGKGCLGGGRKWQHHRYTHATSPSRCKRHIDADRDFHECTRVKTLSSP